MALKNHLGGFKGNFNGSQTNFKEKLTMIKCISIKNEKTGEVYLDITLGKEYKMLERVPVRQVRIWNDRNQPLNYPTICFEIDPPKRTGNLKLCPVCNKRRIYKDNMCNRCRIDDSDEKQSHPI